MGEEGLKPRGGSNEKWLGGANRAISRQKEVEPIGAPPPHSMWGQEQMGLLRAWTKNTAARPMHYQPMHDQPMHYQPMADCRDLLGAIVMTQNPA